MKTANDEINVPNKVVVTKSDGLDQLNVTIGKPQKGDYVKIHFKAYYLINDAGRRKLYEDTFHREKMAEFQIGTVNPQDAPLPPNVRDIVATMNLGEVALIKGDLTEIVRMDGTKADEYRSPLGVKVPVGSRTETEVHLIKVGRAGQWHHRKPPADNSSFCMKCIFNLFRFY